MQCWERGREDGFRAAHICYLHAMLTTEQRGLFDASDFFQFSCSIPAFVLYITVVSLFTVNYSLAVPEIGSLEKIARQP